MSKRGFAELGVKDSEHVTQNVTQNESQNESQNDIQKFKTNQKDLFSNNMALCACDLAVEIFANVQLITTPVITWTSIILLTV